MSTENPTNEWQILWDQRCSVLHRTVVTLMYHRKRQRFFDLADKATKAATVLLGATLLGAELKTTVPLIASAIAGLGLLALVFGYGDRKQCHKELAEAAAQLAARVEGTPVADIDDGVARSWDAELMRLNHREPPALATLVQICEWEQARAAGHPDHVPRPGWARRLVADFVS